MHGLLHIATGAAASSLRLHGRKLAQQPLPELIADSVASAATMSQGKFSYCCNSNDGLQ